MRVAIMQPYFMPYIGYFQLIAAVDLFIIYDNIEYTKKGWINRNRLLQNGTDCVFSLPLKKDSDFLHIRERELAGSFDRRTLLNQIKGAYQKAPYFADTFSLIEGIVASTESNLFEYLHNSLATICTFIDIKTRIVVASRIPIDHNLKSAEKVLALCSKVGADTYVNPIGGTALYSKEHFRAQNVELQFLQSKPVRYNQFGAEFIPWLSIIDVLMFNPPNKVTDYLMNQSELI